MPPREPEPRALRGVSYNLDNYRDDLVVKGEVRTLVKDADFLVYQEGAEYADDLDKLDGVTLFTTRRKGGSERDAGILVRHGLPTWGYRLTRTNVKWPKDKAKGMHWPRSFPQVTVDGIRVVSVHMPRNIHAAAYAACWVALLGILLKRKGPVLLVGDWNKSATRRGLFTPSQLARLTGCTITTSGGIDYALARGCVVSEMKHEPRMGSDHLPVSFSVRKG